LGVNFGDIPINQPVCPFRVNHRDGQHQHFIQKSRTPYYPNRHDSLPPATVEQGGFHSFPTKVSGVIERTLAPKFKDYYTQATLFYNSLSEVEKEHLIGAAQFELGKCDELVVQQAMIERFNLIDHDLAVKVAEGLNEVKVPDEVTKNDGRKSEYLSQVQGKQQGGFAWLWQQVLQARVRRY
jgi:catalase